MVKDFSFFLSPFYFLHSTFSLLLFIFLLLLSTFSFSQNSQLQNFNTKEGLPQSQVEDIVQDSIGYLWLATQGGGLAQFDGAEFTVFNEKNGLKSNFINSLLVSNDSLFVGTFSGLSIYSKGKFSNYESPKILKIKSVNGQIYLATDKGIYLYKNDSLKAINTVLKVNVGPVYDIAKGDQFYWVATRSGLWQFDQLSEPNHAERVDEAHYTSLRKINGQIIGTTSKSGINILGKERVFSYNKTINNLQYIDKQYWVSTDSDGIIILDNQFQKVEEINQSNGLAINQIQSVLKDKQENIWIATSGGGLYKLTQNNFKHFNRNSGLRGNRIYAVHQKKDELWISTSEKGITKIDGTGIAPIFEGTEGKGILLFKRKYIELDSLNKQSKYNKVDPKLFPKYVLETDTLSMEDGLTSNMIRKIIVQDRSVWVATYSSGIMELIYGKGGSTIEVWEYYGTRKGIRDLNINDIEQDNDGKIWYATAGGNLGYIENSKARGFYQILEKEISISTIEIRGNNIFLGTLGDGIWVVNKQSPREIKKLSGVKELNSENIYQIIFDNENNLWAGTEKGVNKIVLDENNSISDVFYFDRSNGFLGIETCQNAVSKDSKGNIWFGTMNGLTKYSPTKSQAKKIKPTVYFENIEVAYQPVDSININTFSEVLPLKPMQNHLSFEFKSIDINHPKGIEYRWKLNGDFSPWDSKDYIDFPNLRYGDYELVVEARNVDWIVSDPIHFEFSIERPLLQKPWFQTVLFSVLGLVLLIIILFITKRNKRKNKQKLEQLKVENHLLSLEQKALQLQMNPHFIFNVLNGIKAMGSEGETDQMNTTINTFATLLRSILNSSRQEEISLQEEIKTLDNYLTLEQQMAAKSFEFDIHHETQDIDIEEILIPPMLIQPFVENSVKHGFQHNAIKGKIEITFTAEGEFLKCEIKDNGIGIEQSKLKKKSHHPSTALKVTKERIESLTKDHQLIIKEDTGTIVSFRLPLKTDF